MMDFLNDMIKLPMSAMTTGMDMLTEAARGVGRMAGEGLNYVGGTLGDSTEAKHGKAPAKRSRSALDASGAKLVEFVLVDLRHGQEQVVDRGYRVLSEPTTEKRFASGLIDAFVDSPAGTGRKAANLQAYVEILERWER